MAKRLDHPAGGIKKRGASRGETLVETIVAFSVLMLLLTMALTVVRSGIALNNRASANLAALYAECKNAELGGFAHSGDDMLTLTYVDGTAPGEPEDYACSETVQVFKGSMLYIFQPQGR